MEAESQTPQRRRKLLITVRKDTFLVIARTCSLKGYCRRYTAVIIDSRVECSILGHAHVTSLSDICTQQTGVSNHCRLCNVNGDFRCHFPLQCRVYFVDSSTTHLWVIRALLSTYAISGRCLRIQTM